MSEFVLLLGEVILGTDLLFEVLLLVLEQSLPLHLQLSLFPQHFVLHLLPHLVPLPQYPPPAPLKPTPHQIMLCYQKEQLKERPIVLITIRVTHLYNSLLINIFAIVRHEDGDQHVEEHGREHDHETHKPDGSQRVVLVKGGIKVRLRELEKNNDSVYKI